MKLDAKSILRPTAVLFIICVVVSAALAGTNLLTRDRIAQLEAENAEASRKIVLPQADTFEPQELSLIHISRHRPGPPGRQTWPRWPGLPWW